MQGKVLPSRSLSPAIIWRMPQAGVTLEWPPKAQQSYLLYRHYLLARKPNVRVIQHEIHREYNTPNSFGLLFSDNEALEDLCQRQQRLCNLSSLSPWLPVGSCSPTYTLPPSNVPAQTPKSHQLFCGNKCLFNKEVYCFWRHTHPNILIMNK